MNWTGFPFSRLPLRATAIRFAAPRLPNGLTAKGSILGAGAALAGLGALVWLVVGPSPRRAPMPSLDTSAATSVPVAPDAPAQGVETPSNPVAQPPATPLAAPVERAADAVAPAKPPTNGASSDAPADEPERLVRRMQDVQELIAAGDAGAYAELPRLMRTTGQDLLALPAEVWKKKQNARALVLYLLSGGSATIGRKIVARQIAPSEEPLAKGAIAYLEGLDCAERDGLLTLDARALDPALGAQLAFVQSTLLAGADRAHAVAQLDLARLFAPGGLVEEAALRREIGLLAETSDFDKFAALSRQYWTRFRHSPYADHFLAQFRVALARVAANIKIEQWAELDEFVASETLASRRALYLAMAKSAAIAGNAPFAFVAAERALALSPSDSVERQRALLYRAAAQVADADPRRGGALLRDTDRVRLPPADQPLYDAVALVSARIFWPPETSAPPPSDAAAMPVPARAEASLKKADAAIEAARQSQRGKGQ